MCKLEKIINSNIRHGLIISRERVPITIFVVAAYLNNPKKHRIMGLGWSYRGGKREGCTRKALPLRGSLHKISHMLGQSGTDMEHQHYV